MTERSAAQKTNSVIDAAETLAKAPSYVLARSLKVALENAPPDTLREVSAHLGRETADEPSLSQTPQGELAALLKRALKGASDVTLGKVHALLTSSAIDPADS